MEICLLEVWQFFKLIQSILNSVFMKPLVLFSHTLSFVSVWLSTIISWWLLWVNSRRVTITVGWWYWGTHFLYHRQLETCLGFRKICDLSDFWRNGKGSGRLDPTGELRQHMWCDSLNTVICLYHQTKNIWKFYIVFLLADSFLPS